MKLQAIFLFLFFISYSSFDLRASEIKFSKITVYSISKSTNLPENMEYSDEFNVQGTVYFYLDAARIVIKYMMNGVQHTNIILVEKKQVHYLGNNVKEIRYIGKWDLYPHYRCNLSVIIQNNTCKIEMKEFKIFEDENTYSGFLYKYNTNNDCP